MRVRWSLPILLMLAFAATMPAHAAGGVYVAGQGFTLEQAVGQALREQQGDERFWVVVSGDISRRVAADTDAATRALVARVQERGGIIYACGSDLPTEAQQTLPPGVGLVSGASDEEAEGGGPIRPPDTVQENAVPDSVAQHRLILRTCAALE